ncbi:P22 phage major capsid protein family protein [Streptomyces sp. BPTC-684]|uniref:P22 phage major capsid protein family protein n=1 Tax=Streptomyces sp. BPTC-684 TaxID=3043734 RepID=UPI0024B0CB87|nr:P22 phage major capsid protein family protein [Streptomyces sp. BPTC-684]WHM40255.1 P22 phage major capsid protein family protein [Streptomyces sp. BPTC-684]
MANVFAQSNVVAKTAASMLKAELVLGRLVHRSAESEFMGGRGDTVRVRVPHVIEAKPFTGSTSAVTKTLNEQVVPVVLTTHAMNGVELTAKDTSLNIESFGAQVLAPQVAGVAEMIEGEIARVMQPAVTSATLTIDVKNPRDAITKAGEILDSRKVGAKTRVLVVSPNVKRALLMDPNLSQADSAGSTSVLQDAIVGRLHGFDVFMSPYIADGAVAMTKEAYAAAIVAPIKPESATGSSAVDDDNQGYAMTVWMGLDVETRQERSICEAFVGATVLDVNRAVGLKFNAPA